MSRILVIGCGGAGKSTLAVQLAERLQLPLVALDQLYWHPGWVPTSNPAWDAVIEREIAAARWIMDGNYGRTLRRRLQRADTVVWLDFSRWRCLWRVFRRQVRYLGRVRPGLPDGCRERLSLEFASWIWTYPTRRRPGIMAQLAALPSGTRVITLRTPREVATFLATLPSHPHA